MVGTTAAIASGDASNVLKGFGVGAGAGIGSGVSLASKVNKNAVNVGRKLNQTRKNIVKDYKEASQGEEAAERYKQKHSKE